MDWQLLVALGCSLFVLLVVHPNLIFSNTTTTGGDTGAHFIVPYFAGKEFFSHGSLTGWSPIWYDGFPLLGFYFPLPSLITWLVAHVIPYGVSFKLVTLVGSLGLPPSMYFLGRSARLRGAFPALLALGSLGFLMDPTFTIDGGNLLSTFAGEYSFSLSLTIGVCFLAVVMRGLDTRRQIAKAAILFGLCALAHLLPAIFVAAIAATYVFTGRQIRGVVRLVGVGVLGGGLIALWIVPFASTIAYSNSMGWEKVTTYMTSLAPMSLRPWIGMAIVGAVLSIIRRRRFGITFTLVGIVSALAFLLLPQGAVYNARMIPFYVFSIYVMAAAAAAEVGILIPELIIAVKFGWRDTGFDFWRGSGVGSEHPVMAADLSVRGFFVDIAPVERSTEAREHTLDHRDDWDTDLDDPRFRYSPARIRSIKALSSVIATIVFAGIFGVLVLPTTLNPASCTSTVTTSGCVSNWSAWNYSGYEGKPAWPEYERIMSMMRSVGSEYGCGRAMWEYNTNQGSFGTPMALMLLPYWTNGCVDSMEGLFFESSATTPYHFLNQSELSLSPSDAMTGLPYSGMNIPLGVEHLQLLGVRYFMATSPQVIEAANADPSLQLIRTLLPYDSSQSTSSVLNESWDVYLVKGSNLVQPLSYQPVVWKGMANGNPKWLTYAVNFYDTPSLWSVFPAQSGPSSWKTVPAGGSGAASAPEPRITVSHVVNAASSISFDVSKIGVPTLVKISYFPNWHVSGATGPYRVAPNLMVVVPTSRHVVLTYGMTSIGVLSEILSVVVIAGLLAVLVVRVETMSSLLGRIRRLVRVARVVPSGGDADRSTS